MACEYNYKGQWYTEAELATHPDFKGTNPVLERMYINNNTGPNTDSQINLFSPQEGAGVFTKFIQFKKTQLHEYMKRLKAIEAEKRKGGQTVERLTQLNKLEKELSLQINGNPALGVTGLKDEIADLMQNADINAVSYYVEKDIQRLSTLSNSNNIEDLQEAQRIIDFYDLAGTFRRGVDNPFFGQDEIFLTDENGMPTTEYRLSDETMQQFKDWKDSTIVFQNIVDKRKEEVTVNIVNQDPSLQKTFAGKQFTFGDLIHSSQGLKDADWISMWTMDITQGIRSHNGLIPQVMFSYLANSFEKKLAWARKIEEDIDRLNPQVQAELIKLGYTLRGGGIVGLRGASYQIFKEVTKEGNETGGLVQRFIKEFFDEQAKAMNKFSKSMDAARAYQDYGVKSRAFNRAFEEIKKWRRINTHIIDVDKIPEFMSTPTPEAIAYKQSLVAMLGEKGYKEHVDKQQNLLNKYEAERLSIIDTLLINEGKSDFNDLSAKAKSDIVNWENTHNPKAGVKDYYSVNGIFVDNRKINNVMNYNVFVPRKYDPAVTIQGEEYVFADKTTETGFYDKNFQSIESNPILSEFYDVIKEVATTTRETMPLDLQQRMSVSTIPAMKKSFAEIMADKNTGTLRSLFLAFRHIIEKIRVSFGVVAQSEISYATIDPITGKTNYKVNDQFLQGNVKAVTQRQDIERVKFLQSYNATRPAAEKIKNIKRFSIVEISKLNPDALQLLAQYINVNISNAEIASGNLKKITDITGTTVDIGKYIRDFSLHSVVQSQSFDLGKVGKYAANMTMGYAARQEALPILEIMKQHYEKIQKPRTTNLNKGIYNVNQQNFEKLGLRTNAMKQMDNWFERVVLDNYGGKHGGLHGAKVREIKNDAGEVKTKIPFFAKKIFTNEEKEKIREIDELLSKETNEDIEAELRDMKKGFGKERVATAAIDNLLAWIRTLRLGYNFSSASTNLMEGVTSNMILSSLGQYFDEKEIYYGYGVIKGSFVKNATFGLWQPGESKKNRMLMDKFNVIMDSKNELQKSSVKTYTSKFSFLNPHELNQRVEFINQSPIMIAMLRTVKIKDANGVESSVWDAMTDKGHLKDNFKTQENINNWENHAGDEYLTFKQKLNKAIVLAHGNYDELRGMMIKTGTAGKALMMFKTWIPMQLYQRFAVEQADIQSGTTKFKGRYMSYSGTTAAIHGAIVGTAVFGPLGTLIGAGTGAILGGSGGTNSGVSMLAETVEATKALLKKIIGMPVNILAGRQIIGTGNKAFEDWVGKGDFTSQDAQNMRGNMADISVQLAWLALILVVKGMFWDDDEETKAMIDKAETQAEKLMIEIRAAEDRITHNIAVNKLMQLSSQGAMYVNPVDTYKNTIQSNATWQYLTDVGKEIVRISEALHGRDIITSGVNAGKSGLGIQSAKVLMPGLFKDNMFGFGTQAERVFEESPFHPYFRSQATLDKEDNKRDRAEYKLQLEETVDAADYETPKEYEKAIKKMVDTRFPTGSQLQKKGLTREEYEAQMKEE